MENPALLALREEFRLKQKAEKSAVKPTPKYLFGSDGKKNYLPFNIFSIVGFVDWVKENKKDILNIYLLENDLKKLIEEFKSL